VIFQKGYERLSFYISYHKKIDRTLLISKPVDSLSEKVYTQNTKLMITETMRKQRIITYARFAGVYLFDIIFCSSSKLSTIRRVILLLCIIMMVTAVADLHAQELEPRAYSNAPIGLNFLLAGYGYTDGDVLLDPSVPLENAHATIHTFVAGYVRSVGVWGRSGKVALVLPYAWLSAHGDLEGQSRKRKVSGFADPRLRLSINLYGAPALSPVEFKDYRQKTIVGMSLLITAPFGQYDSDRLANIGTNRWSFKPELGISRALGRFTLELASGISFFTDNDNFLGGQRLEQAPIYSIGWYIIYNFKRGLWASIDGTYYTGGRTTVAGDKKDNELDNWRYGLTLAIPLNRSHSIKLYGSTGLLTRTGSDFDSAGIAWQYRWGGGL